MHCHCSSQLSQPGGTGRYGDMSAPYDASSRTTDELTDA